MVAWATIGKAAISAVATTKKTAVRTIENKPQQVAESVGVNVGNDAWGAVSVIVLGGVILAGQVGIVGLHLKGIAFNPLRWGELMANTSSAVSNSHPFAPLDIYTEFLLDDTPPGSYDFTLIDPATGSTSVKVPSPCKGTIIDAGSWGGYGNGLDLLCDDGHKLRMTHFDSLKVKAQDKVELGQALGVQGTTGNSTGDHVHMELWIPGETGQRTLDRNLTRPIVDRFFAFWKAGQTGSPQSNSGDLLDRVFTAITQQESGGDCSRMNGSGSQATGIGQVMPENIPSWTQAALGRSLTQQEFLTDCNAQIATVKHRLGLYLTEELANANGDQRVAVMRVAARWYSGSGDNYTSTRPQYWNGDSYPSINSYSVKVAQRAGF